MIDSSTWALRPHPGRKTVPLVLTTEQRARCEALLRCGTTEQRTARRAQAVLLLADGVCAPDVARLVGVHVRTVEDWRHRIRTDHDPLAFLTDAPRTGRRASLFLPRLRRARVSSPRRVACPRT